MAAAEALTEGIAALVDDFDTIQEYNLAGIRGEKPRLPHGHFLENLVWPGREMMVSVSTLVIFEEFSRNPSVFSNGNIATIAATMGQLLSHLQSNVETAGLPIPWALHGPRIDLLRDPDVRPLFELALHHLVGVEKSMLYKQRYQLIKI